MEGRGTKSHSPLQPCMRTGPPPEAEQEMQERAWERIRGGGQSWRSRTGS